MSALARDPRMLLARIEPVMNEDGEPWWPLAAVCEALHVPSMNAARYWVPKAHRRNIVVERRRYELIRVALIDREGLRRLAIRFGRGAPVSELVEAATGEGKTVRR